MAWLDGMVEILVSDNRDATFPSWWGLLAMDIRTKGRVERWIEPPVLSYILQRPIHS